MLQIWALAGIGEVTADDDLAQLIGDALAAADVPVADGDILVVTSKIVSKAEGRFVVADDREDAITRETVRVVATRTAPSGHTTRIVENRLGIVSAAAGVDASNTPEGTVLLLPEDPDASARALAAALRDRFGVRLGVLVSDTLGRAWRDGQTDHAIGAGGVHVFEDLRGEVDAQGRPLVVTLPCVADELCAAADLVKRKATGMPVAVVRGRGDLVGDLDLPGARSIVRTGERDMFRLGADEAYAEGYAAGRAAR
ncbi:MULTISPECIES: coenzyme F420-0:L-glutamate ligase [unclassified Microbacterium]|uniref:coenzyme F420-0:L-glutamate ligase n=1 Tax=Microbacterium TaxID=33882 RepID=UPI002B47D6F9|nr:coenzyme F420-0:L-glutamate ligase [Microbacterium sp. JZ37]WRH16457.1 coenzyme F420-0:L-glutamate ligase [Microbacterium sp. JZ37]